MYNFLLHQIIHVYRNNDDQMKKKYITAIVTHSNLTLLNVKYSVRM